MFGDLFNTRGDYSRGLFYSGANKYLDDTGGFNTPIEFTTRKQARRRAKQRSRPSTTTGILSREGQSSLPTRNIQSASGWRNSLHPISTNPDVNEELADGYINKLTFHMTRRTQEVNATKVKEERMLTSKSTRKTNKEERKNKGPKMLVFERSLNANDWRESREAGCKLWIHKSSREVLDRSPWSDVSKSEMLDVVDVEDDRRIESSGSKKNSPRNNIHTDREEVLGTGALVYDSKEINSLFDILDGK